MKALQFGRSSNVNQKATSLDSTIAARPYANADNSAKVIANFILFYMEIYFERI